MLTLWNQSPFWGFNDVDRHFAGEEARDSVARPRYDVQEKDGGFDLSFEMPGVAKDKLQVELKENTLTVAGEGERRKYHAAFSLPSSVDTAKVAADYKDGVLHVTLPKAEAAKARLIQIAS